MNYPTNFYPIDPRAQMPPYPPRPDMGYPQPGGPYQPVQPSPAPQGLSPASRLVTGREEAMGVAADFSGAPMVFPDVAGNRVFIKRWNFNTGSADFLEFVPVVQAQPPQEQIPAPAFVPLQDFQNLQDVVDNLRQEVDRLKKPVGKAVRKNEPNDE